MFELQLKAHVTRIVDGDTLEVEAREMEFELTAFGVVLVLVLARVIANGMELDARKTIRVRLLDCWAAERGKPGAEEATRELTRLALDRLCKVRVLLNEHGKFGDAMSFGRVLARVEVDGRDLSEAMVAAGMATKKRHA